MQYAQYGETALAMARDEDTVKCFFDAGIKLSDIVTDEVVIAFVPEMGLCCTCVWERATGRESRSIWYVGERGRTRLSEQTHTRLLLGYMYPCCPGQIRHQVGDWNDGAGRIVRGGRH